MNHGEMMVVWIVWLALWMAAAAWSRRTYVNPLNVVSKAKSVRSAAKRSISRNTIRAAAIAASSGLSGDRPLAIRSAFTK